MNQSSVKYYRLESFLYLDVDILTNKPDFAYLSWCAHDMESLSDTSTTLSSSWYGHNVRKLTNDVKKNPEEQNNLIFLL